MSTIRYDTRTRTYTVNGREYTHQWVMSHAYKPDWMLEYGDGEERQDARDLLLIREAQREGAIP